MWRRRSRGWRRILVKGKVSLKVVSHGIVFGTSIEWRGIRGTGESLISWCLESKHKLEVEMASSSRLT